MSLTRTIFVRILKFFSAVVTLFFVQTLILNPAASANGRRAIEMTFLKSKPTERETLKAFIVSNWFEMDKVAQEQGLIESYKITDTGSDEGDWNLLVTVTYYQELGYEGIKKEFDAIAATHQTRLIDGKNLRELGVIVKSNRTFETVANASSIPKSIQTPQSQNSILERNKTNVLAFYDLMFNQSKPAQAMELYGAASYKQHNPEVPDGKEAFIAYFERLTKEHPKKSIAFKRVIAEGQFVVIHSEQNFPGWRGGQWAAIDIFRLETNGKIAEHWDVLQKVPSNAVHSNGMF
jgi:predicted SnoaL-like aldol condensation-catalyzing enzyme